MKRNVDIGIAFPGSHRRERLGTQLRCKLKVTFERIPAITVFLGQVSNFEIWPYEIVVSVCPSVCPSVRPPLITFEPLMVEA